ncbi:hypothetical protein SAMN06265349_106165 [Flavobacterium resistens]|uniref:Uncharacterized protein n=1 Tax=Flavobacterium resistens TaxID=443612 RepID=A0A521F2E8_9FLAO|nr:hypothetical protein [Flavobacterium resistens]MRX69465.1 hypothetical protein [Flavobacterium resistens]SMO90359.1 hypothetical protein SAMN06265349_106165 [Flavobacterium resistens]
MKNIVLFLAIIFYSCKSKNCASTNNKLVAEFEKNIKIVQTAHNKKELRVVEYRKAIIYLSNTTGIMTLADYTEPVGYLNDEDYIRDMKLWKKWLNENRCM